ncbi:MAG: AAA family ATPase [Paracoccaceae bacterium]|nr:AAA family ATPase [Paracoccaceae bacterium]
MELLDRERELEALSQALSEAVQGCGSVALVTGEAGIGKTSLLRAFAAASDPSVRVLRGACEDLSVAEPLGPLRDLLRDSDVDLSVDLSETDRHLAVYSDILEACAGHPGGTAVIIEDLHWADDATVDFVRFLARRIIDQPILLVVSSRAERTETRQLLRRAFGDLSAETLQRIPLAPLSEGAVAALCRAEARDPAAIFNASGGNAFYVTELLRNQDESLPTSIRDAVLARVDRLDDDARSVLEAASVIPRRAEIALIEAVLAESLDLDSAIEGCLNAGLLFTDGDDLFFQHEIARQAVSGALSSYKARALHRRLLDRLRETGGAGLSRLLHHAQGAGDIAAVAELAPRAAEAAAGVGSRRESAAFYILAVEAAGEQSDADLLEAAAFACYLSGRHFFSEGYQVRALKLIGESDDPIRYGDGLRKLSRYRWVRSDFSGAFEGVREAIRVLEDHRGPELAQAYSSYSQLLMTGYRMAEIEAPATRAIELAREFDRPDIICHALNNLGMSKTQRDTGEGRHLMAESLRLGRELKNPDHTARAMINWMHLEYDSCNFENALERAEIAVEYSREQEMDTYLRYSLGLIARANLELGHWEDVAETAARGFDPDDRIPYSHHYNGATALLSHQIRTGGPPDSNVEAYLGLFDHDNSEDQRIAPYAELMAERAWLSGEGREPAIARLRMIAGKPTDRASTAGIPVWLKRLGVEPPKEDASAYPKPRRLELDGDHEGAARAWAERKAPYNQALTLAFGTSDQQAAALEIFESLGAAPAVAKLREMLGRKAPTKRGRPAADGPYGLTGRQLDVLRLLDDGLTNSQIGEKLFISPKTVDHHVSAILARLEAASRGEAAAKARKLDLI